MARAPVFPRVTAQIHSHALRGTSAPRERALPSPGYLRQPAEYEQASDFLASVVMRLPAWNAALAEVRGHIAAAHGDTGRAATQFRAAAEGFGAAGHPLERRRCLELAGG